MKKAGGFTKRMVAILLSSMLAVGTIPGTALAAEVQEIIVQEEEAIITHTVTLDANGGYFVNLLISGIFKREIEEVVQFIKVRKKTILLMNF